LGVLAAQNIVAYVNWAFMPEWALKHTTGAASVGPALSGNTTFSVFAINSDQRTYDKSSFYKKKKGTVFGSVRFY
jgi:hypothetical protein